MAALPLADTLQSVELADGVEIHLRVAGPAPRCLAWLLDLLIYAVFMIGVVIALSLMSGALGGEQIVGGISMLLSFFLAWFYNVFFEMGKKSATPGQRAVGLKVASVSGGPVRLPQSIIRNLLRVVDFMPMLYLFGLICCLFTRRFQRLGDLVADTVVVYADPKAQPPPALQVNAEAMVPSAALSRAEQAALVEFLERAPQWSDARKIELSDLLEPLTQRTGLPGLVNTCGVALWVQHGGRRNSP
jgi:uncharacterized RDD family membrane protein YckC